jgi:hypothetical protein
MALAGKVLRDDGCVLAWWYICIGIGFVALAARAFLTGASGWGVGLRIVVALGFVLLGVAELSRRGGTGRR